MKTSPNRRVRKENLEELLTASIPLLQLADYTPFDPSINKEHIASSLAKVNAAREQEKLATDAANKARDLAIAAEREYCELMIAARRHCVVQYGQDSSVVRALGLKRRSEYKRATRTASRTEASEQA